MKKSFFVVFGLVAALLYAQSTPQECATFNQRCSTIPQITVTITCLALGLTCGFVKAPQCDVVDSTLCKATNNGASGFNGAQGLSAAICATVGAARGCTLTPGNAGAPQIPGGAITGGRSIDAAWSIDADRMVEGCKLDKLDKMLRRRMKRKRKHLLKDKNMPLTLEQLEMEDETMDGGRMEVGGTSVQANSASTAAMAAAIGVGLFAAGVLVGRRKSGEVEIDGRALLSA